MFEEIIDSLSDEDFARLIHEIKVLRWRKTSVPTLCDLCVQHVIDKAAIYAKSQIFISALKTIPTSLIQKILREFLCKCTSGIDWNLLLLFCTVNQTEFDFKLISNNTHLDSTFDTVTNFSICLHHLRRNCPKIVSLRLGWPRDLQFEMPLNHLNQWSDLKFLSAQDFIFDQNSLQLLAKNHKRLEGLELSFFINGIILPSIFAEFRNLRKLSLLGTLPKGEQVGRFLESSVNKIFAAIATAVPKLSQFQFELSDLCPSRGSDGFIEEWVTYDRNDSAPLHLLDFKVFSLKCPWPAKGLNLKKLIVYGDLLDSNPDTVENLRTIPAAYLKTLELNEVEAEPLYQILQILGSKIDHLELHWTRPPADLNLYKILQLCSSLQSISLDEFSTRETIPDFVLEPDYFKQMKNFTFFRSKSELINRYHNCEIFKAFLIGSRNNLNSHLHVFVGELLQALLIALESDPVCLKYITDLELDVQFPEQAPILAQIVKIVIQRAPALQNIRIGCQAMLSERRMRSILEGNFTTMTSELGIKVQYVDN